MKKQTMSDLMLRAHFNVLRDELNRSLRVDDQEGSEVESVLKDTFHYLKSKSQAAALDDRGVRLFERVAQVLDTLGDKKIDLPGKLPMQKAKGTMPAARQKKTGS